MILVDTSIWIDHINKGGIDHLDYLLSGESVVTHPFIIGEIAMGSLKNRGSQLAMLGDLHKIAPASDLEVRTLVESAHLLASAIAHRIDEPVRIWTGDKALFDHAAKLNLAYT
jgi:predicted nucleic acid-binding protein